MVQAPGVDVVTGDGSGSAERLLGQVAAWLLPGAVPLDRPAGGAEAMELVDRAIGARMVGPLVLAVEHGGLWLPDDQRARLAAAHEAAMQWCLHLEQRLLEVVDQFDRAGIDVMVIKGPAVAHLDEPDPALRSFGDLDLLVRSADLDRAVALLQGNGARRRIPEHRPGFDRRFEKSVGLTGTDQVELDVHRTLCLGPLGVRIPLDDLFGSPEAFELGGVTLHALAPVHRALHAAYHAVVGSPEPPLHSLRDLAGYLTRADLGPDLVAEEARRWRGETVLGEAVRSVLARLPFDAPAPWRAWAGRHRADPRDLRLLARSQVEGVGPLDLGLLRELGWRDRAGLTWSVAFPSPESLAARGLTPWGRIRGGVRRALPRRGGSS